MSVIINELEITTTPEASSPPPNAPTQAPPAAPLTPFELRAVLRHLAERSDRVRAD